MKTELRKKPYKARRPEETISMIRNLLLDKLGILTKEEHYKGDGEFFSCRVTIANSLLCDLNIGTNGKGMTIEYALASAYGEFMERLQNQILFQPIISSKKINSSFDLYKSMKNKNLVTQYLFAPDEYSFQYKDTDKVFRNYARERDIKNLDTFFSGKTITTLPYYNVFKKRIDEIPVNMVFFNCTSNGMCAGNTPKEAIIQGLCEILERYVIKKIYYDAVVPPSIPIEFFRNTDIYEKAKAILCKYDWDLQIKDCSCGIGIPAIGILIINKKDQTYHFHIGSDPSPVTALERALTELYQGRVSIDFKKIDFSVQNSILNDKNYRAKELFRTYTTGSGDYPLSLLFGCHTYNFNGFDLSWSESDEKDLKKILLVFQKLNADIYIRDVSFLEFPAYSIYVPNMSEFRDHFNDSELHNAISQSEGMCVVKNLANSNIDSIKSLLSYLEDNPNALHNLRIFNVKSLFQCYDANLIKSLLYYTVGDLNNSHKFITSFLTKKSLKEKEKLFFNCLSAFIESENNKIELSYLESLYGRELFELCKSFIKDRNYLQFLPVANCYNCTSCRIKSSCKIEEICKLQKKIEYEYINNTPDQINLSHVFE